MNPSDLQSLEKENERLNKIISVLLEQNDALKNDNSILINYILKNQDELSPSEKGNAAHKLIPSLSENSMGRSMDIPSNTEKNMGSTKLDTSISENNKGRINDTPSISEKDMGRTSLVSSIIEKYKGRNTDISGIIENDKGGISLNDGISGKVIEKSGDTYSLPQTIAASGRNHSALHIKLKQSSFRISHYRTREAAAKLLIHFYNKGTARYTTLKSLTGYSIGGIGKLMMLMRKKRMIQRSGFQQFTPSAHALYIMKEARLK